MISNSTREKAKATKAYLEQKYATMKREREESRERRNTLEQQMAALRLTERKKEQYRQELRSKELQSLRHQRKRLAVGDFQPLAVIGRGAFGEVRLVRKRDSGEIFALKSLEKSAMVLKNQVGHVKAERDILASADNDNNWLVTLHYSFQDDHRLYMFDYVLNQLQVNDPDQCGLQYQELVRQITSNFDEFTEPCELPAPPPAAAAAMGHVPPAAPMGGINGAGRGNAANGATGQGTEGELPQAFGPDGKPLTFNKFIGYTYKRKPPVRMALNDGLFDGGAAAVPGSAETLHSPAYHSDANVSSSSTQNSSATRQGFEGGNSGFAYQ
ncbi:hypothetical protein PHYBOEH_001631 [Phytophthora boehmeriae]|uniref:non-specific serine/threonine protein kinase n=1 Tax=Phytophthora boehmeriae TaxID=109152 RepID=A0A8T1WVV5_9STRA|nr:hypothetical protein PHYBOEH_001631 [Phytophthora boehmeriae]